MDIKKYEVFVRTVEKSSLTKAAEEFGLTQSGVSHIIASMEDELGLPLLKRSRTGVRLTPEGEKVMPFILNIVEQERMLKQAAAELHSMENGIIRIGTFTSVATHWLPAMMMSFQNIYPKIKFQLFNGDYYDVEQWLDSGVVDIAFTAMADETKRKSIPLYKDELMAVLPPNNPLCASKVCRAEDLANEPFIALLESSNHDARSVLDAANVKPDIRYRIKDDYAVIAMVRQGLGVSIMPSLLLYGNNEGVELRHIDPPASRTIAIAFSAGDVGPAACKFAEFAMEWVNENADAYAFKGKSGAEKEK